MAEQGRFSVMEAWFGWVLRNRTTVLGCGLLLLVVSGFGLRTLDIDFAIESFFSHENQHRQAFADYTRRFGRDDDAILVLCQAPEVLTFPFLEAYDRLASDLARLPMLRRVDSLLDVPVAYAPDDMEIRIRPLRERLFPAGRPDPAALATFAADLSLDGPFLMNYVNPKEGTALLVLRLAEDWSDNRGRQEAVQRLRAHLASLPHPDTAPLTHPDSTSPTSMPVAPAGFPTITLPGIATLTLAGMPVARADGMVMIQNDQRRLLPLSLAVTLTVLFFVLNGFRDIVLVVLTTAFTLAYTFGLMGWLGWKFSFLTSVAPVILVTTGTTYCSHPLVRLGKVGPHPDPARQAQAFAEVLRPLSQCAITTIVGFGSLLTIPVTLVHQFAFVSALGVAIAFAVAMTLLPALVSWIRPPRPPAPQPRHDLLHRLLNRLHPFVRRHPGGILVTLSAVVLVGGLAATRLQIRAFVFDDFRPDSPLMKTIRQAEKACHGLLPLAVLVEAAPGETVLRHRYLSKVASITAFLRTMPEVGKVDSPTDFLMGVWRLLQPEAGRTAPFPPDDSALAALFRLVLSAGNLGADQDFIARDLGALQIKIRLFDVESGRAAAFIDRVRERLAVFADASTTLRLTGTTVMIQETYRQTITSFLTSLGFVIAATFLVVVLFHRDPRLVWWAMAGNLGPLVCVFGFMATLDVPIKISTITIFGIALGLAVDDTIHFLTAFRAQKARGRSNREAAGRAIIRTGRGMVVSSLALFAGFLVLLFSEFEAQYLIGLMLCFSITAALVFDLAFTPAGVAVWGPRDNRPPSP
ncbi:MAG: MMPL family transporter [Candidatus Riflebacteria bacterium]|nr:MMPL family transporter [Candidatus Riflebacteria bacterium]